MSSVHGSSILIVGIFRVFFFSLLSVSAINRVIQASQSELAWISLRLAHNAPVSLVSTAHNDGIKCQQYSVFILHLCSLHSDASTLTQTRRPAVIRGKIQNGGHSLLKDFLSTFILNTSNQKALFMAKENDEPLQWSGSVAKLVKFSQETCTITPVERQKQDEWLLGMWVQFISITDLLGSCWVPVIL